MYEVFFCADSFAELYSYIYYIERRTFHVPKLMQMSSNKELSSFTLGSSI
jgi:hypothetical protein